MTESKKKVSDSGIVALAFNKDRTQCAFSPNNHQVFLFSTTAGGSAEDSATWVHTHTLEQHEQAITAIDWHPATNRILTASQDRQAFVWVREAFSATSSTATPTSVAKAAANEVWVPQMVVLDASVKRGLMCCKWSPSEAGAKIYVGSAASNVAMGVFSEDNGWWVCRVADVHTSTVTTIAPHPHSDLFLASGSTDGTVCCFSVYSKSTDGKAAVGEKFGTELSRVAMPSRAWVLASAWNPMGTELAVATQASRVHIIGSPSGDTSSGKGFAITATVVLSGLPLKTLAYVSMDALIGAGFDFFPVLIAPKGDQWVLKGKWTGEKGAAAGAAATGGNTAASTQSQAALARAQFQNEARFGQKAAVQLVTTKHKNTICSVVAVTGTWDGTTTGTKPIFATSAMDGTIEFWKPNEMSAA